MSRAAAGCALALLVLAAAACGGTTTSSRPGVGTRAASELVDLRSTSQLRTIFNASPAEPRLVLLISPT